jgi:exodeoxyribonuclease VII large subunit
MSPRGKRPSREPFDPHKARGHQGEETLFSSSGGTDGPTTLTVSQLTRLIKGAIKREFAGDVHVVGELSNVSRPSGGHIYFTLKDASCEVRCVMWRSSAKALKFDLTDGQEVVATGEVDVYEPRGQYQLYVRRVEPRGVGSLELAFRQLKSRLEAEGLFAADRKRRLPAYPQCVAVVTSPTGAAVRDILQTLERRFPNVRVCVFGVRVQGEGAAEDVADAIRRLNRSRERLGGIDVMIVGRGGGSLEDLWAFNEEVVARAIFASEIPVVSAVGHEVDFTIADFVADVRAATPTAAAELVVPDRMELLGDLENLGHRQWQAVRLRLEAARAALAAAERCEWLRDPIGQLRRRQQEVDEASGRLQLAISRSLSQRKSAVHDWEVRLARVRPEAVLARRGEAVGRLEHRLRWAFGHLNLMRERALRSLVQRMVSASPRRRVEAGQVLLDQLEGRLSHGVLRELQANEEALKGLETRLAASSHEQVLRRGFTITRRLRGDKLVRAPRDVRIGDRLETETSDGKVASRVVDETQGELFE